MSFEYIMNVSFKAKFIQNASVLRINKDNSLKETPVSFVKMSELDTEDMYAMNKIANNYKRAFNEQMSKKDDPDSENYAESIRNNFNHIYNNPDMRGYKDFFALTTQQEGFEYIDNQKVLGLAETFNDVLGDFLEIRFLQTNPLHKFGENTRELKKIGTTILDCLRNYFKGRTIYLQADYNVIDFYKKYGFEVLKENHMVFKA